MVSQVIAYGEHELISCGHDADIRRWDLRTQQCVQVLSGESPHGLTGVMLVSDDRLVSWGFDNTLSVWSLSEAKLKGHLIGHTSSLSEVIALGNDRLVSCADFADDVRIWDLKRLGLDTLLDEHSDVVVFAHRRGDQLVTGSHDETLSPLGRQLGDHTAQHPLILGSPYGRRMARS